MNKNNNFLKDYFEFILKDFNKIENDNENIIFENILNMDSLYKKINLLKNEINNNKEEVKDLNILLKQHDIINKQYFKSILKESLNINEFKKLYHIYKTKFIYNLIYK